jgi:hypothetical protein
MATEEHALEPNRGAAHDDVSARCSKCVSLPDLLNSRETPVLFRWKSAYASMGAVMLHAFCTPRCVFTFFWRGCSASRFHTILRHRSSNSMRRSPVFVATSVRGSRDSAHDKELYIGRRQVQRRPSTPQDDNTTRCSFFRPAPFTFAADLHTPAL